MPDLKPAFLRSILASPSETTSYLIDSSYFWSSTKFYRIEGNVVQPPHLVFPGCGTEYLGRWRRLFVGALLAWLTHLAVLAAGIALFRRGSPLSEYRFGNRIAKLASTGRRVVAGAIDLLMLLAIVALLTVAQAKTFGVQLQPFTTYDVCNCLMEYEQTFSISLKYDLKLGGELFLINIRGATRMTLAMLFGPNKTGPAFLYVIIVEALCLFGLKTFVEGRLGVTPGKWLLGIRTLRSTLVPCGFARTLTRSVLLWIDIPFFVTPIPAALSLILSTHGQRLGDRIADTIVVNAGSIRELPSQS